MWWGFSPALDLTEEIFELDENVKTDKSNDTPTYNVLLIGQYDGRHVLKTIAQKYRHKEDINLNVFVYEPLLENVAREILFITLALEPGERIGICEKTLFFMELYGNTLLRPSTSRYLSKISKQLLNMITNLNYTEKILPTVSLNNLKYKERDQLEIIFKYWASCDNSFDILKAWDERLRKHLGVRYDSRSGVYDWDYHMRYRDYGADLLKLQEYKSFREKGVAFYFEDTNPCLPNSTMASGIFSVGSKLYSYGYLGDIITGPFVTFGLSCEDEKMLKKVNGQPVKNARDITEHNILRLFYEIQHQNTFCPSTEGDEEHHSVILEDHSSKLRIMQSDSVYQSELNQIRIKDACEEYQALGTNNCKVIFLPTSSLLNCTTKSEFENLFDLVFISQSMALKYTTPEIFKMFKSNCKIIVESPKFLLSYRTKDFEKFKNDLENLMNSCQSKLMRPYDFEKDEFLYFKVEK